MGGSLLFFLLLIIITVVLQNTINVITVLSVNGAVETPAPIVVVQGYVYCKSCNTLAGATPLAGAVVRLECNSKNTTQELQEESTTNKNGYFAIKIPTAATLMMTTANMEEQCKVVLVSSGGQNNCSIPTDINSGLTGAVLKYSHKVINKEALSVQAFKVGPFAFEPQMVKKETCSSSNTDDEDLPLLDDCDPQCLLICGNGCCHCTY